METKLLNLSGKEVGKYDLPEFLFSRKPDVAFLHEAVKYYMANKRRGCASTKTRGEVSGGGHKPWKQKGTGRARSGSNRSPVWRKGGIVFGPRPHSHKESMPETKRRSALLEAIAAKYAGGAVMVIENLDVKEAKTKNLKEMYAALGLAGKKALFIMDKPAKGFIQASRNIPGAGWSLAANLNAYEVLHHDFLIFTVAGVGSMVDYLKEAK
ncbi:MAG: 50S ribosomal protein L4 [Elusimicrobia bacterium RIFOXYB2_FULL_62_6]|nr:MAG: 50S ribosomal protein L4 [Elusimicrobia bacterium RIFOXYB2_FULL_62_6]